MFKIFKLKPIMKAGFQWYDAIIIWALIIGIGSIAIWFAIDNPAREFSMIYGCVRG